MSPADSEGANLKSLVFPDTKMRRRDSGGVAEDAAAGVVVSGGDVDGDEEGEDEEEDSPEAEEA